MKVACVLANGFEDSEFKQPYDALKEAGHEVTIVGLQAGQQVNGDKGRETATVEKAFADVRPDQFDALLIPGGFSPDRLRAHPVAVEFVKAFFASRKPIMAICHGPQIFIPAGAYKDHRMTAWKTIQSDLKLLGANVVDEEVVVDRNLVTSRQPQDIPAFVREGLKLLEKAPAAAR
ncbi:MAG TPA: type 1 glutamine amidotransferase domain-containing protein [Candidatus Limnocylindria bacterium]|nr:type 1 glutamine amidotransferase domain-containing protein [Candidatus Limnocylindria bacterium]